MSASASAFLAPNALGVRLGRGRAQARTARSHACAARRTTPAVLVGSAPLLTELNTSHVRELSGLIISFGAAKYTWEALTSVRATHMDERGLAVEAVMCDGEGCVARLEELSWPEGPVSGVDEALSALRVMVDGAGLDGNVILSDPILERD